MAPPIFGPATSIPSLAGKVILITGGTSGLGRETVLSFASHGAQHIYFTGRSQSSADKLLSEVKQKFPSATVSFLQLDLASLESVKAGAAEFLRKEERLDILILNAGIMAVPPALTKDGYEVQFGTNHLGHAALTKLLLPTLSRTASSKPGTDVRIVSLTSLGYKFASTIHFDKLKTPQEDIAFMLRPWARYGQSKLANLLYVKSLAKRYPNITSVVVHPGVSATGLVDGLSWGNKAFVYATTVGQLMPPAKVAWNQQWAATAELGEGKGRVQSGVFYEPVGLVGGLTAAAKDEELEARLWEWTEEELGKAGI